MKNINNLFEAYPILKEIDRNNSGIISEKAILKSLLAEELMSSYGESCVGFLFVISGSIKIQRINENGEETHLYNIKRGELCHEALSCFLRCETLSIVGKAIQDSEICIIPFEVVNKYLLNDIGFMQYIYKDLHKKFNKIISNKEESKYESLEKRLIKLLISKKSNIIYTTHSELAFELDSAREVISRKLKDLEKNGYVKGSRGKIQILKDLNNIIKE